MSFAKTVTEDRRLSVLLVLAQTPGYCANAFLLRDAVASVYGHNASHDQMRGDIAWLDEQGLVESETKADVTLAKLTVRGLDVSKGLAVVPGVRQPNP